MKIVIFHQPFPMGNYNLNHYIGNILQSNGYKLVCADVGNNSGPQEDWYIHPSHIDQSRWEHVVCADLKHTEVRKLMGIIDERLNW